MANLRIWSSISAGNGVRCDESCAVRSAVSSVGCLLLGGSMLKFSKVRSILRIDGIVDIISYLEKNVIFQRALEKISR